MNIISHPPEPGEPSPAEISAVERAESEFIRLRNTYNILTNIFMDVETHEETQHCTFVPSSCLDVITALEGVGDAAQVIVASIGFTAPPDDQMPFEIALWDVQLSAQEIVDDVSYYLEFLELLLDCGLCAEYDETVCGTAIGCSWVSDPGYCCAVPGGG